MPRRISRPRMEFETACADTAGLQGDNCSDLLCRPFPGMPSVLLPRRGPLPARHSLPHQYPPAPHSSRSAITYRPYSCHLYLLTHILPSSLLTIHCERLLASLRHAFIFPTHAPHTPYQQYPYLLSQRQALLILRAARLLHPFPPTRQSLQFDYT